MQTPDELSRHLETGIGGGLGSLLYGLTTLSEITSDPKYSHRAAAILDTLSAEQFAADENYDILRGTAGTLLGLLKLYEHDKRADVLSKAITCGEHLLESRYSKWGYEVWDTSWDTDTRSVSTGMGHGVAGISYALYRLGAHTDDSRFSNAAREALRFENIFYSPYHENWKANWDIVPNYTQWWCYGLAGIGCARLGAREYNGASMLDRDIDRVKTGLTPTLADKDTICHGTFSQVEKLIELGRKHGAPYHERARDLARSAVLRKRRNGGFRDEFPETDSMYNPSFFLGSAGIGYTLLRLQYPTTLPSILRFE